MPIELGIWRIDGQLTLVEVGMRDKEDMLKTAFLGMTVRNRETEII